MNQTRIIRIGGQEIELEPSVARRFIHGLIALSTRNPIHQVGRLPRHVEVLRQLLETDQLTACERHFLKSNVRISATPNDAGPQRSALLSSEGTASLTREALGGEAGG